MKSHLSCIVTSLLLAFSAVDVRGAEEADQHSLPVGWMEARKQPPLSDRPLQIVHGIDPRNGAARRRGPNGALVVRESRRTTRHAP